MASSSKERKQESTLTAVRLLGTWNLHRCLWLPATASHERLRVAFSTTSNFDDQKLPVVLFCGPMFGSRYASLPFDKISREAGIRMICVDRPGMGGSSPVLLEQRINVWLETVRALLDQLKIKHVSLVSHSAGTLYSLNTLYNLRDILDPVNPYVAYFGPWVHNAHSRATLMNIASKLPKDWIGSLHSVTQFVSTRIMPMGLWSGGVVASVAGLFQAEPARDTPGQTSAQEKYGVDDETAEEIERLISKYLFAEGMSAAGQEALLCLKQGEFGQWGSCEDYEQYVQDLSKAENERHSTNPSAAKLKVRVFFAESDIIIGNGGKGYFEKVWQQDGVAENIDVESREMPGTDHDSVLFDFRQGALREVLRDIGQKAD